MHTLPVRDAIPAGPLSPKTYMILQYNSCSGEVVPRSSSLPAFQASLDMRDAGQARLSARHVSSLSRTITAGTSTGTPAGSHRPSTTSIEYPLSSRRRNGTLGSVVRKIFTHRPERSQDEFPMADDFQTPAVSDESRELPPAMQGRTIRSNSTSARDAFPMSPLTAHPMAVADAGDTAARVNQFLSQRTEPTKEFSASELAFPPPAIPHEETWFEAGPRSLTSAEDDDNATNRSSVSSKSTRRRSRSVSALTESSRKHSFSRLRPQKSDRNLASTAAIPATPTTPVGPITANELKKRHNVSLENMRFVGAPPRSPREPAAELRASKQQQQRPRRPSTAGRAQEIRISGRIQLAELPAEPVLKPEPAQENLPQPTPDPRRTFDFDSLMKAMKEREQTNIHTIEERMGTIEVKLMDLEYALSKVYSKPAGERSTECRSHLTQQATKTEATTVPPGARSPLIKRKKSPPAFLQRFQTAAGSEAGNDLPEGRSSMNTIRPARKASNVPPLPTLRMAEPPTPAATERGSANLMTAEQYDALMNLLRSEQTARKELAEKVCKLQAEIASLRPTAHSPSPPSVKGASRSVCSTSQEGDRTPVLQGWANVEEFKNGKPVSRRARSSAGSDRENPQYHRLVRQQSSPRLQSSRGRTRVREAPPSPTWSDSSSDASFGNAFVTPREQGRFEEATLITHDTPAGQAF